MALFMAEPKLFLEGGCLGPGTRIAPTLVADFAVFLEDLRQFATPLLVGELAGLIEGQLAGVVGANPATGSRTEYLGVQVNQGDELVEDGAQFLPLVSGLDPPGFDLVLALLGVVTMGPRLQILLFLGFAVLLVVIFGVGDLGVVGTWVALLQHSLPLCSTIILGLLLFII